LQLLESVVNGRMHARYLVLLTMAPFVQTELFSRQVAASPIVWVSELEHCPMAFWHVV
jgi:hypothetical protein